MESGAHHEKKEGILRRFFIDFALGFAFYCTITASCNIVQIFNDSGMWMCVKCYPDFVEYSRAIVAYPLGHAISIIALAMFGRCDPNFFQSTGYSFVLLSGVIYLVIVLILVGECARSLVCLFMSLLSLSVPVQRMSDDPKTEDETPKPEQK